MIISASHAEIAYSTRSGCGYYQGIVRKVIP